MYFMAMNRTPSASPASYTSTMLGCAMVFAYSDSRAKRWRKPDTLARSGVSSLMATVSPVCMCSAW